MDPDMMKKLGVIAIVVLLAIFIISALAIFVVARADLLFVAIYAAVYLGLLAILVYEGWQRIKEIEEGLEDAVDNY